MNTTQRRILITGLALFALSALFPPWQTHDGQPAGLAFLLHPPIGPGHWEPILSLPGLLVEWVALGALLGLAWLLCGGRRDE